MFSNARSSLRLTYPFYLLAAQIVNVRKTLESRLGEQTIAIFYLDYLNNLLSGGPPSCRRDSRLITECFLLNLKTSKVDRHVVFEEVPGSTTGESRPKRGSYNTKFLNEEFFLGLLHASQKYRIDFPEMLRISREYGFWKAYLVVLMETGKDSPAIELALQLDDVAALEKAVNGNKTPQLWEFVISHFSSLQKQRFSLAPVSNPITEEKRECFFFPCGPGGVR